MTWMLFPEAWKFPPPDPRPEYCPTCGGEIQHEGCECSEENTTQEAT